MRTKFRFRCVVREIADIETISHGILPELTRTEMTYEREARAARSLEDCFRHGDSHPRNANVGKVPGTLQPKPHAVELDFRGTDQNEGPADSAANMDLLESKVEVIQKQVDAIIADGATATGEEAHKLQGSLLRPEATARPAHSRIQASMDDVVVLPWVPATASTHLLIRIWSASHCGPDW